MTKSIHYSRIAVVLAALLAGCASQPTQAPVVERSPIAVPPPPLPVAQMAPIPGARTHRTYVVKPGDTLYSIALEQGVDYHDLAHWNHLDDPTQISVGQTLQVSPPQTVTVGAARGSGPVEARPLSATATGSQGAGDGSTKSEPKALRLPYSEQNMALLAKGDQGAAAPARPAPPAQPAAAPAAPTPAPQPPVTTAKAAPGGIAFVWPAKGKLLAGFSQSSNKGVDIGGKIGDPVYAAAPGRIMYTGTGIRGYGKLIVIKHQDGFNSVYAHNSQILVKEGQMVKRGERIAILGETDAKQPMLHFEIRKSGKPVDPLKYLPGARPSS